MAPSASSQSPLFAAFGPKCTAPSSSRTPSPCLVRGHTASGWSRPRAGARTSAVMRSVSAALVAACALTYVASLSASGAHAAVPLQHQFASLFAASKTGDASAASIPQTSTNSSSSSIATNATSVIGSGSGLNEQAPLPDMLRTYSALLLMAVVPIFYASFCSIDRIVPPPPSSPDSRSRPLATLSSRLGHVQQEVFSSSEAYLFPFTGSAVLLSLYLIVRYIGKEYINMLLSAYFAVAGLSAMAVLFCQVLKPLAARFRATSYDVSLKITKKPSLIDEGAEEKSRSRGSAKSEKGSKSKLPKQKKSQTDAVSETDANSAEVAEKVSDNDDDFLSFSFTYFDIVAVLAASAVMGVYLYTKHWILNNVLSFSFSVMAIRLMALDSFKTGFILLAGLFLYDIFWVFGTDVMVTVAVNLDAPIKVVFPRDLFSATPKFAMLGLGDIVVPGIFVALCLRFDYHRHLHALVPRFKTLASRTKTTRENDSAKSEAAISATNKMRNLLLGTKFSTPYFHTAMIFYVAGLLATIFVMHFTGAAQPALLYLSPACIFSAFSVAFVRRETRAMLSYSATVDEKLKEKLVPSDGSVSNVDKNDSDDELDGADQPAPLKSNAKGSESTDRIAKSKKSADQESAKSSSTLAARSSRTDTGTEKKHQSAKASPVKQDQPERAAPVQQPKQQQKQRNVKEHQQKEPKESKKVVPEYDDDQSQTDSGSDSDEGSVAREEPTSLEMLVSAWGTSQKSSKGKASGLAKGASTSVVAPQQATTTRRRKNSDSISNEPPAMNGDAHTDTEGSVRKTSPFARSTSPSLSGPSDSDVQVDLPQHEQVQKHQHSESQSQSEGDNSFLKIGRRSRVIYPKQNTARNTTTAPSTASSFTSNAKYSQNAEDFAY